MPLTAGRSATGILTTCAAFAGAAASRPAFGEGTGHLGPNAEGKHNLPRGGRVNTIDVLALLNARSRGC